MYAKERTSMDLAIGKYQAIEFKLARMEVRAWTARQAHYAAVALMLNGKPFYKKASITKRGGR